MENNLIIQIYGCWQPMYQKNTVLASFVKIR